jgi:hypothetical protein
MESQVENFVGRITARPFEVTTLVFANTPPPTFATTKDLRRTTAASLSFGAAFPVHFRAFGASRAYFAASRWSFGLGSQQLF